MKILLLTFTLIISACATKNIEKINSEAVEQNLKGKSYKAQVFYPALASKKPAVIVVHEWWGHNDYARSRARQLAELGYVAMSIDMFGNNKIAKHPKEAGEFASAAMKDPKLTLARFNEAIKYLKSRPDVNPEKIAAIGYCFGGTIVLNMVRMGADLEAAASFHGSLKPVVKTKQDIDTKIAVYNGAADPMVTAQDIKDFKTEMRAKNADFLFKNYEGALHAFTNPLATENGRKYKLPLAYNSEADQKSWESLKDFLAKNLY